MDYHSKQKLKKDIGKLTPYLLVMSGFVLALVLAVFMIDSYLLPHLIHEKASVEVPNVVGMSLDAAKKELQKYDFQIKKVVHQNNSELADGTVLSQDPKPGESVREGRRFYLTVSKGEEFVTVPYIIGQSQRGARILLMNKGLKIQEINYEFSEQYGQDTVIGQSKKSGQKIELGSTIDIVVSKGSEMMVLVPKLIGQNYELAESLLTESGLLMGEVSRIDGHDTFMPNTIVSQTPLAGELVAKNTVVNITVTFE